MIRHGIIGTALLGLTLSTGGCAQLKQAFPQTVAGWEANGFVGAVDGATGAIIAICEKLDGERFRVAIDNAAERFGVETTLEKVREIRAGGAKDITEQYLADGEDPNAVPAAD